MMQVATLCKRIFPVLLMSAMLAGCSKMLDVEPEGVLGEDDMYQDVFDADAAVIGIYGKFMQLAEQDVLLNELRADLLTVTTNAGKDLRELNEHDVQEGNEFANPRAFYEVILNCNDVLFHFDRMLADKKLKEEEYNMRYSDVAALRCWVYLQLAIQYGNIPYVTDPLSKVEDLSNILLMPRLSQAEVIDELIRTMEALPYMLPYSGTASLSTTVDGYNTNKFFINKKLLLGQLYLWKGYYHKAAIAFKDVMESGGTGDYYGYRVTGASKGDNDDLAVGYIRYRELDENMLVNSNSQGWRSIFARSQDDRFNDEWIWFLPYSSDFQPVNPFPELFSNRGGDYLLKPSQLAMDNWNGQVQKNDFPYDARGKKFTWNMLDDQPVIMKYLYNYLDATTYLPVDIFSKNGKWMLYRAATLHLAYAEAANRDHHPDIAYALLDDGISATIPGKLTTDGYPYDFDARKSDIPKIVGDWYLNSGIRGRANLYALDISGDSTIAIENGLIDEAGLELAYEGQRWADLVRIAQRRNDPAFLADKIYQKLLRDNNPQAATVRQKLMNPDNWYLPFDWE